MFYDAPAYRGGKHTCCKKCHAERVRRSFKKNEAKRKSAIAAYKRANAKRLRTAAKKARLRRFAKFSAAEWAEFRRKRQDNKRQHRAKKYGNGGRHSESDWQALLKACGRRCLKCRKKKKLTRDHIIPLTKGGSDAITNIQPLCRACNSSKSSYSAIDYRSGEAIEIAIQLAAHLCKFCGRPFEWKSAKKEFCRQKCSWGFRNRQRREAKRVARQQDLLHVEEMLI